MWPSSLLHLDFHENSFDQVRFLNEPSRKGGGCQKIITISILVSVVTAVCMKTHTFPGMVETTNKGSKPSLVLYSTGHTILDPELTIIVT